MTRTPLLATLLPVAAAASPSADAPAPEAPRVSSRRVPREITVLADNPRLNVPELATLEQRQEWVVECLSRRGASAEDCDLRTVKPFDVAWWDLLPNFDEPFRRVSLDLQGPEPARLRWNLMVRGTTVQDNKYISHHLHVDARTGVAEVPQTILVKPGRPFEGRLAACGREEGSAASAWVERARHEHASVASFARHLLELMSLGAPLELLAEVSRAQADEVRHTALALERAAAHGVHVALGPLDTAVPTRRSAYDVALGVALEGCVNETLAAEAEVRSLADATGRDAEVLASIAADEAEHAALAWRTLDWLLPQLGRAERRRVRTAMYRALHAFGADELVARVDALAA